MTELEEMRLLMRKTALAAALSCAVPNGCVASANTALELAGLKVRVSSGENINTSIANIRAEAQEAGLL